MTSERGATQAGSPRAPNGRAGAHAEQRADAEQPPADHPADRAPLDRAGKIASTQRKRWDEVRKARRARELLRMAEPIIRRQAELGDPTAEHIRDRLGEVL